MKLSIIMMILERQCEKQSNFYLFYGQRITKATVLLATWLKSVSKDHSNILHSQCTYVLSVNWTIRCGSKLSHLQLSKKEQDFASLIIVHVHVSNKYIKYKMQFVKEELSSVICSLWWIQLCGTVVIYTDVGYDLKYYIMYISITMDLVGLKTLSRDSVHTNLSHHL